MSRRTRFERERAGVVTPRTAAELIATGVTRHALRGPAWVQTSYGRYVPAAVAGTTPAQRVYEAAAALLGMRP